MSGLTTTKRKHEWIFPFAHTRAKVCYACDDYHKLNKYWLKAYCANCKFNYVDLSYARLKLPPEKLTLRHMSWCTRRKLLDEIEAYFPCQDMQLKSLLL